ncbi:MAG: hypothetical protein AVDCRST_MAG15-1599 [uncultured Rubellimicrobium sp.]|uniref:Uncharacterized protein n=1 Tax=uncultured Rubellimicrobium sp. TaxID=543078 RepID=A0A6J4P9U8_9RHOB|nr:MAG: hypothetical protein AVDCRST_MAG15-1599 [uncultured Rubellimicrobium sp.]
MTMGHLMLGLLGGFGAFVMALVQGQPAWMALLLYTSVGNLCLAGSLLTGWLLDRVRQPPGPPRQTARLPQAYAPLALRAGH